jgi:hypothetical protein
VGLAVKSKIGGDAKESGASGSGTSPAGSKAKSAGDQKLLELATAKDTLTPEQQKRINADAAAQQFEDVFSQMPTSQEMAAIAWAGKAKRCGFGYRCSPRRSPRRKLTVRLPRRNLVNAPI